MVVLAEVLLDAVVLELSTFELEPAVPKDEAIVIEELEYVIVVILLIAAL